jgi:hypothetical protein
MKLVVGAAYDFYYNEQWQELEVRKNGTEREAYVWHPYYVDALAVRYHDSNENGNYTGTQEAQYALQDDNFNVTASIDALANVLERFFTACMAHSRFSSCIE